MEHRGGLLQWAFFPPVVAVLTVFVARSLGSPSAAGPVDPSLWGLTGLLFVVLTVLYSLFILQGRTAGCFPVQLIAQGLLLCPLSIALGARMLQWVGVTLAVCGAVVLVTLYYRHPSHGDGLEEKEEGPQDSSLPIPFAVTDPSGRILSVSDALLEIAGLSREEALASDITAFLVPGEDTTTLGDKAWNVSQHPMKDDRFFFQLDPRTLSDVSPAPRAETFVDPFTSLYSQEYAMRRLGEELYCVRRYGHILSAALIHFAFPPSSDADPRTEEAFRAFCRAAQGILRASDIPFLTAPRDLFLILPETDDESTEAVVAKLDALVPTLCSDHPVLSSAMLLRTTASVRSGPGVPEAGDFVRRVDEALKAKYTLGS